MELNQLFKVQQIIENQIRELSDFEEDYLGRENVSELRFLAMQVKLGELADLTKCYKYARINEDLSKDRIMTLYIDSLKYLLSIGNMYKFNIINKEAFSLIPEEKNVVKLFSIIYEDIISLKKSVFRNDYMNSITDYIRLFARFVNLGKHFNLNFDEVYDYYMKHFTPVEIKAS